MRKKIELIAIAGIILIGGSVMICLQAIRSLLEDIDYKRGLFSWRLKK